MHRFKTKLALFKTHLWDFHFLVPPEIASALSQKNKRVVCTVNGSYTFQCALMPVGDGNYFINANKVLRKKLNLLEGDLVEIQLVKDESKYGLPMPAVFEELLLQDVEGEVLFHALTPGKQRDLLYIIGKPKNDDLKAHKGVVILNYLKLVNGKLDFKELIMALKMNPFKLKN